MFSIKLKPLIISLLLSLSVGVLAGILTSSDIYLTLNLPPLSPPPIIFPIVWTILYFLMGISSYIIYTSNATTKKAALTIYLAQLAVNFVWPFVFFTSQAYLAAFVWLVLLWVLVVVMIYEFYRISPTAAYLQIPYLIWIMFAGYLNLSIYLLN